MMMETCRLADDEELDRAAALAQTVYDACIASEELPEGRAEFRRFALASALRQRHAEGAATFVAELNGTLVAMLHLRHGNHIAMLFVDREHQRKGIGKRLVAEAERHARHFTPALRCLTVNSTPNSVDAYQRMGFKTCGAEQVSKGIRFVPMERKARDFKPQV